MILSFVLTNHTHVAILQISTFEKKNAIRRIIKDDKDDKKDVKLYLLDPLKMQMAYKLSNLNQSIYSKGHSGRQ